MKLLTLTITKTEDGFVGVIQIGLKGINPITSQPFEDLETALKCSAALLCKVGEDLHVFTSIFTILEQLEADDEARKIIDKLKERKNAN